MQTRGKLLDGKSPAYQGCQCIIEGTSIQVLPDGGEPIHWEAKDVKEVQRRTGEVRITLKHETAHENDPVLILPESQDLQDALESMDFKAKRKLPGAVLIYYCLGGIIAASTIIFMLAAQIWKLVPEQVDVNLGESSHVVILQQLGAEVTDRPEMLRFLETTADRLEDPGSPFDTRVTIVDNSMENAFALPGGRVYFTTGLLDGAQTPEEIAGILAHEIVHVEKRHGMQNMSKAAGLGFVITTLVGVVGGLEEFGAVELLIEGVTLIPLMHYSRKMETEADSIAMDKLGREGISAAGMRDFFARISGLDELESGHPEDGMIPEWLSTHPASSNRIEAISQHVERESGLEPLMTQQEWEALQKKPTLGKGLLDLFK